MHSPRPYGLLVVNGKLTENDNSFIDHQLKKLSNQKALSNLDSINPLCLDDLENDQWDK